MMETDALTRLPIEIDEVTEKAIGMRIINSTTREVSEYLRENERNMRIDMMNDAAEMLTAAGFQNVTTYDNPKINLGLGVHEMGTARMGRDPLTSVLNGFNQIHSVRNVFVTDSACMTSASCVNPASTYMALTARAAHFAVEELKRLNL